MKRILTIWRDMTGAERGVLAAATLALAVTVVAAPFALLKRPDDVSNPDAAFAREEGAGKEKEPKPAKTVNWTRYGYDTGRSKFLDSPRVRPRSCCGTGPARPRCWATRSRPTVSR